MDFRRRIEATAAFVEEIFRYSARNAREIVELTAKLDEDATKLGLTAAETETELGVRFRLKTSAEAVEILIGNVRTVLNPRSRAEMTAVVAGSYTTETMLEYGSFQALRTARLPVAYVFGAEDGLRDVLDRVQAHGLRVEEAGRAFTAEVQAFKIKGITRAKTECQGHRETLLNGDFISQMRTFSKGAVIVRTAQPLSLLLFYLLEPESDDGLANWNFLEDYLETSSYPIYKIMNEMKIPTRLLS